MIWRSVLGLGSGGQKKLFKWWKITWQDKNRNRRNEKNQQKNEHAVFVESFKQNNDFTQNLSAWFPWVPEPLGALLASHGHLFHIEIASKRRRDARCKKKRRKVKLLKCICFYISDRMSGLLKIVSTRLFLSYLVSSYLILSYLILSRLILSYLARLDR